MKAWWSEQPESGTTYSAPRPGDLDALRRLREPFGRSPSGRRAHRDHAFGYIESALVSGRVARLVAETVAECARYEQRAPHRALRAGRVDHRQPTSPVRHPALE